MATDGTFVPRRVQVEDFAQDGECLLYNPDRDEASTLNRTATEIWELCDGTVSIGAIALTLSERYQVNAALLFDEIASTIDALRARGLLELLVPPPASP